MAEARAAGWSAYQDEEGDDSSIEGEFDLENDEEHTASNSWSQSHNKSQSYECPTDEEGSMISGSADSQLVFTPAPASSSRMNAATVQESPRPCLSRWP